MTQKLILDDGFISQLLESKENIISAESKRVKEVIFCIPLSRVAFPPERAFYFILNVVNKRPDDFQVYEACLEVSKQLINEIDLNKFISEFPKQDLLSKSIIVRLFDANKHMLDQNFILSSSVSRFTMNRVAFLLFLEKHINYNFPEDFNTIILNVLDALFGDSSPLVLAAYVKPFLHYSKGSTHFKSFAKRLLNSDYPQVRASVALNFSTFYDILGKSVDIILEDNDDRVVSILLPNLVPYNEIVIDRNNFHNLIERVSNKTLIVQMIRYLRCFLDEDLVVYLEKNSDEITNEIICYLGRYISDPKDFNQLDTPVKKYVINIMENIRRSEDPDRNRFTNIYRPFQANEMEGFFKWRSAYEILRLPFSLHHKIGSDSFEFALGCLGRHPMILCKKALEVVCNFAEKNNKYAVELDNYVQSFKDSDDSFLINTYIHITEFLYNK